MQEGSKNDLESLPLGLETVVLCRLRQTSQLN